MDVTLSFWVARKSRYEQFAAQKSNARGEFSFAVPVYDNAEISFTARLLFSKEGHQQLARELALGGRNYLVGLDLGPVRMSARTGQPT